MRHALRRRTSGRTWRARAASVAAAAAAGPRLPPPLRSKTHFAAKMRPRQVRPLARTLAGLSLSFRFNRELVARRCAQRSASMELCVLPPDRAERLLVVGPSAGQRQASPRALGLAQQEEEEDQFSFEEDATAAVVEGE